MARLISGEFNDRTSAREAADQLVRAGIPRDDIHLERELPNTGVYREKRKAIDSAECERRWAGRITGGIAGFVGGAACGSLAGVMEFCSRHIPDGFTEVGSPVGLMLSLGTVGALVGLLLGAVLGYAVDRTLTLLGAGPASTSEECLLTVYGGDMEVEEAKLVLAKTGARHILSA